MINIKNEYIDNNGKLYNIRNINLDEKKDLRDNIGTFVTETKREANYFFDSEDALTDGVYIYKSNMDPNKALRIYKDCSNYPYVYHNDIVLISKLQEKQKNIKLTEFPTGIITIQNTIIGQEIPFYEDYKTLHETIENLNSIKELINYYKKMLDILIELENNGMIYTDLHFKNFMVKNNDIKLIDFEDDSIKLDYSESTYKNMIYMLRNRINKLNQKLNIEFLIDSNNLKDIKEEIYVKSKRI